MKRILPTRSAARQNAQSFLKPEHQAKVLEAYHKFSTRPGFAFVATTQEVLAKDGDLSIPQYVEKERSSDDGGDSKDLTSAWSSFEQEGRAFWTEMEPLVEMLDRVVAEETSDA